MEVTFTLPQMAKLTDQLSKVLPERGRSAFVNVAVRNMPDEKVEELRALVNKVNVLTAAVISPQSVTIPYEDYVLIAIAIAPKGKVF